MNRLIVASLLVCGLCLPIQAGEAKSFLDKLSVGQGITLKTTGTGDKYEIILVDGSPTKISEIGKDYVEVKEATGTLTTIPVYSIKCIVKPPKVQ